MIATLTGVRVLPLLPLPPGPPPHPRPQSFLLVFPRNRAVTAGGDEWPSTPPPLNNNTTHHNNNGPLPLPLPPPSPFRFEEHRPYRFAEDMGPLPPGALVGRLGDSLIPKGDPMEARLQEMLRYNMDKYANTNLDTLHISRRVRELLSVHNIGQRLFAKYVLGLSQGTVSELLSKPKPWDKLTEKGRDSYRKMHAWACDEAAIMLLKSLIPKKGIDATHIRFANELLPLGSMSMKLC
ncbi:Homeobox protein cut [Papilio machaon]|uniref:Homeobox protein cut n=1 Tax=Papilio machaon TaxID=76193 RepID=A0A0N1I6V4_PAPMA|nr:Homeobox protein cut [Papilio machaon]